MNEPTPIAALLSRVQRRAFVVGIAATGLLMLGFLFSPGQAFQSYLMAFLAWLAPTLGALAIVMLHNMTGGAWGFAVRRLLEAAMRNVPLTALFFLPILLFGIHSLYEWSHADAVAVDPILQHKAPYLNRTFFTIRAVLYFGIWSFFALMMVRLSERYDRRLEISALRRLKVLSGVGLVVYFLTMSFASFDWGMSLEPHWFSMVYGVLFVIGQGLSTLCLAILVAARLSRYSPLSRWYKPAHFHDLGNLLLAFVMLWAYISFSQFLIIWSGNLPEETPYYLHRLGSGWQAIALFLVLFHFAVPFVVLLTRRSKRSTHILATLAGFLFLVRFVELFWLIAPAFHAGAFHVSWLDPVALAAVGGLWVGFFVKNLRGRPLVSLQDAKLLGSLEEAPVL